MSAHEERAQSGRITITPDPTDEELAAVVAVVTALAASSAGREHEPLARGRAGRWAMAGHQEAMRGPYWRDGDHGIRR